MDNLIFTREIMLHNKPLILTNSAESYISGHIAASGFLLLSGAFSRNIRLAKKHLLLPTSTGVIIHDISNESLQELLDKEFKTYKAGGGLVFNNVGKLLMIFRRGYWDLPKGKQDDDEDVATCAIREVEEETGLKKVKIGSKVANTFHIYEEDGKSYIKDVDWFLMQSEDKEDKLVPQVSEDIIMARWVDKLEAQLLVKKAYPIIRDLVMNNFVNASV